LTYRLWPRRRAYPQLNYQRGDAEADNIRSHREAWLSVATRICRSAIRDISRDGSPAMADLQRGRLCAAECLSAAIERSVSLVRSGDGHDGRGGSVFRHLVRPCAGKYVARFCGLWLGRSAWDCPSSGAIPLRLSASKVFARYGVYSGCAHGVLETN